MNIIKQIKDENGNNIYPIGYAQGGMKMDLLWTNPSPSSAFGAQTISVDVTDYSLFLIVVLPTKANSQMYTFLFPKGLNELLVPLTAFRDREVTISDSGFVFSQGRYLNSYNSGAGYDNNQVIPYHIYGIKMSYIVPTSVHGLQYVEV